MLQQIDKEVRARSYLCNRGIQLTLLPLLLTTAREVPLHRQD